MNHSDDKKTPRYGIIPSAFLALGELSIWLLLAILGIVVFPALNWIASLIA